MRRTGVVRALLGLAVGFAGAFITVQAIDLVDQTRSPETLDVVLGQPDIERYCLTFDDHSRTAMLTDDGWKCAGFVQGLWSSFAIDMSEVCRRQFDPASTARVVNLDVGQPTDWRCVVAP